MNQYWSYLLTIVGLVGFILAGKKIWWCWYVNVACQALWFTYAIVTKQYGFIVASVVYTVVFTQNAIKWTREHRNEKIDDEEGPGIHKLTNMGITISKDTLFDNRPNIIDVILAEIRDEEWMRDKKRKDMK